MNYKIYNQCFIFLFIFFIIIKLVKANVIMPGIAESFIYSIILLIFSPGFILFLLPIIVGLLFNKKFVLIWNFISLFSVLIITSIFIKIFFEFESFFLILLYSSFFTIIAFFSSVIGNRFKKIQKIQNNFNNISNIYKIIILFLMYFLIIIPMVYISEYMHSFYSTSIFIFIGAILSISITLFLFFILYKYSKKLPKKSIDNQNYKIYLIIIIIIFVLTFILALIFYPTKGPNIPKFDPYINTIYTDLYGNQFYNIGEIKEINGKYIYLASNISGYGGGRHGYTSYDIFLVYDGKIVKIDNFRNNYHDIDFNNPTRFIINNKITYNSYDSDKRKEIIHHGNELIGYKYDLAENHGSYLEFENKLTYIAKEDEKYFLVKDEKIISEKYDKIEHLTNLDEKLLFVFKNETEWFINYGGNNIPFNYNKIISKFDLLNGKLIYFIEDEGKVFLTYNHEIINTTYYPTHLTKDYKQKFKIINETIYFNASIKNNYVDYSIEKNLFLNFTIVKELKNRRNLEHNKIIYLIYNNETIEFEKILYYEIIDDKLAYILQTEDTLKFFYDKEIFKFNLIGNLIHYEILDKKLLYILQTEETLSLFYDKNKFEFNLSPFINHRTHIDIDSINLINNNLTFLVKNIRLNSKNLDLVFFNEETLNYKIEIEGQKFNGSFYDTEFKIRYEDYLFYVVDRRFLIRCKYDLCENMYNNRFSPRISPLIIVNNKLTYAISESGNFTIIQDNKTRYNHFDNEFFYKIPFSSDNYIKSHNLFNIEDKIFYVIEKIPPRNSSNNRAFYIYSNGKQISNAILNEKYLKQKIFEIKRDPYKYIFDEYNNYNNIIFRGIYNDKPTFIIKENDKIIILYGDKIIDKNIECFPMDSSSRMRYIFHYSPLNRYSKNNIVCEYNPLDSERLSLKENFIELNDKLFFIAKINNSFHIIKQ